MPCNYSYLQENFYNRFDGAVSITVVLKESENKVVGSSPSKSFFYFISFFFFFSFLVCFRKYIYRKFFVIYKFAEKKNILMYYAHVKRLHSVKW